MGFLKKFTKQEISWMMYDWANSAHSVIVVTILPIFFDTVAGYTADSVSSMSTWGFATSLAMAIVALSAPFLGVSNQGEVLLAPVRAYAENETRNITTGKFPVICACQLHNDAGVIGAAALGSSI